MESCALNIRTAEQVKDAKIALSTHYENSPMTTSVLHTLVSRAFPAREALRTLALDQSLVSAWKQLATAAGVDKWALASVIAKELGLEAPGVRLVVASEFKS